LRRQCIGSKNALVISLPVGETEGVKRFTSLLVLAACLMVASFSHAADVRHDFLKLVQREHVPLDPTISAVPVTNDTAQFRFAYASKPGQRVPGVLLKSANSQGRRPVVIVLHGTGGNKEGMLPLCTKLAARGFIAVAIDAPYHGERSRAGKGTVDYNAAIVGAWHGSGEHPFFYDTVWDVMRLVDYLQTRDDVDPERIGLTGISKGGIETYLTAAVDERIAAAVPFIGVQSFHWALDNNDWQGRIGTIQSAFDTIAKESGVTNADSAFVKKFYDKVAPGIYGEFDGPAMLAIVAPRPLLMINSDSDNHTPLPGVKECIDVAQGVYHAGGMDDHFAFRIQEHVGHQVKPESESAMIDWFVRWLKP
jgi:dienelactone hydrolase